MVACYIGIMNMHSLVLILLRVAKRKTSHLSVNSMGKTYRILLSKAGESAVNPRRVLRLLVKSCSSSGPEQFPQSNYLVYLLSIDENKSSLHSDGREGGIACPNADFCSLCSKMSMSLTCFYTVRLLTHVLCKPTHFFFHSFIATMSHSLQTRFNGVMKDWADKYHVWGTPTRSPSR